MPTITLVITGGIAAYKSLILIRRLKDRGFSVVPVMTKAAAQFVTPLSVASLAECQVYDDLFDLMDETQMGHIQLMRRCDFVLVAPASADFLAKMALGRADDLASTAILASDKPIVVAPSMNIAMWQHPATQANVETLRTRGVTFWGPAQGDLACGDVGSGRMIEPEDLAAMASAFLTPKHLPLSGRRVIVTAGPTREAIDPVRYISNHSSGKQGYAIAAAFADAGAIVTLVSGPTSLAAPSGVTRVQVQSAVEMLAACEVALTRPAKSVKTHSGDKQAEGLADIAVFTAAVGDWRVADPSEQKRKKAPNQDSLSLKLVKNPDILASIARHRHRPKLVIGFAAETHDLVAHATAKRLAKNADILLANDVSLGSDTFGADDNQLTLVDQTGAIPWPRTPKTQAAKKLVDLCIEKLDLGP